jgi:hypothetical protein
MTNLCSVGSRTYYNPGLEFSPDYSYGLLGRNDFASVFGSLLDRKVATRRLGRYLGWTRTSKWIDVYLGATWCVCSPLVH